jgi:beta-phosphoglucomutase-like phosphatase (HAD superfamily)
MTALIFDCDGVIADSERDAHLPAFNRAFAEFGLPLRWSEAEYGETLRVGGGKERIASALTPELVRAAGLPSDPAERRRWVERLHARKLELYAEIVAGGVLRPRPGIVRIVDAAAEAGWTLAVASTSAEDSVRLLLELVLGPERASRLPVFAGDVVPAKKPDPAIYELAVERLGVPRDRTLAIEDSRNGLVAAAGAGLRCVVTVSGYTHVEDFSEAALVVSSLGDPGEPMHVLANRSPATPRDYLELADLEAVLG